MASCSHWNYEFTYVNNWMLTYSLQMIFLSWLEWRSSLSNILSRSWLLRWGNSNEPSSCRITVVYSRRPMFFWEEILPPWLPDTMTRNAPSHRCTIFHTGVAGVNRPPRCFVKINCDHAWSADLFALSVRAFAHTMQDMFLLIFLTIYPAIYPTIASWSSDRCRSSILQHKSRISASWSSWSVSSSGRYVVCLDVHLKL